MLLPGVLHVPSNGAGGGEAIDSHTWDCTLEIARHFGLSRDYQHNKVANHSRWGPTKVEFTGTQLDEAFHN